MRTITTRGPARMRELGCKQVAVWLDGRELILITEAAARAGMKLATWIRQAAFHAAEEDRRAADRQERAEQDQP